LPKPDSRQFSSLSDLKESGWPTSALVGKEGRGATCTWSGTQTVGFADGTAAGNHRRGEEGRAEKAEVARLVDRMRVDAGMKQLFGTQAKSPEWFSGADSDRSRSASRRPPQAIWIAAAGWSAPRSAERLFKRLW